jgi:RNA polymerase sigma-B factor
VTSAAGQTPSDHSVDERTSGSVPERLDARPFPSRGPGSEELPGNSAEYKARERPGTPVDDTPVDEAKDTADGVTDDNGAGGASTGPNKDGEYEHLVPLLAEYAELAEDDPRREPLRERLVTGYLPVAQHIARRFAHRGEPLDDLVQVATVGLINAVDRFQPDRGSDFFSFAVPTISGEVRRHFRDQGWSMRVPRRLKDLHVSINSAVSELSQNLGRAPKPSEIAERLRVPTNEVLEGLEAAQAYRSSSLDEMLSTDESGTTLGDLLGAADAELERVDYQQALQPLLAELAERERSILMLRFFGNMTQTQIADRVGVSQMHVSRLLAQTLSKLRNKLEADQ